MRLLSLVLASVCVLGVTDRSLSAQTSADTTTAVFRSGEWGVGFFLGNGVTDAGVLRFSTPTRAWVLDGSASFDRQTQSTSAVFGEQTARSWSVSGQFGPRWYHAMSGHVARFLGLGALASYSRIDFSGSSSHGDNWSLGTYGEAGLQYMLTRYLGLGGRGTLSASRYETNNSEVTPQGSATSSKAEGYHVGVNAVQLTGTIYF